jgi:hypothetical protein
MRSAAMRVLLLLSLLLGATSQQHLPAGLLYPEPARCPVSRGGFD